mgnify:CR=1 FL=1
MSEVLTVGKRYAKALFELARESNQLEQTEQQLKAVVTLFKDEELAGFFQHPSIGMDTKIETLSKSLAGKVSDHVLQTLFVLLERRRVDSIDAMLAYYVKLSAEHRGHATAIVYTPMKLSEAESERIAQHFGGITGKHIVVDNRINPELLGGIQVRIGDRLYDGSLSSKLLELQKILA